MKSEALSLSYWQVVVTNWWSRSLYHYQGIVFAVIAAFAGSIKAVLVKLAYEDSNIDAITLLTLRLLIALPFFLWFALKGGQYPIEQVLKRSTTIKLSVGVIAVGSCGYYFSSFADFNGLRFISAGLERLVLFCYPVFVIVLDALWRKQAISKQTLYAFAVTYLGLYAAFQHDLNTQADDGNVWVGVVWVLFAALSFALYFLGANIIRQFWGVNKTTGLAGLSATLLTLIHFNVEHSFNDLFYLSVSVWFYAGIMAIACTILPSWLILKAMSTLGAGKTASIGTIGPMMTIGLGWWVLNEPFAGLQLVGMCLVVIGMILIKPNSYK